MVAKQNTSFLSYLIMSHAVEVCVHLECNRYKERQAFWLAVQEDFQGQ